MDGIEIIAVDEVVLAFFISKDADPPSTTFITASEAPFQAGFVVKDAGEDVARHEHRPVERKLHTTSEALTVRRGRCRVAVFSESHEHVVTREMTAGDMVIFLGGGHEIEIIEPTSFFEVKQGPYPGRDEKLPF